MSDGIAWPTSREQLIAGQRELEATRAVPWHPRASDLRIGGVFICFEITEPGPGVAGDRAWAAAGGIRGDQVVASKTVAGAAGAPYEPGLLALRAGPLLEAAVNGLPARPDVLLVNATGRDHPRRAGLALHLGALLDLPTVGITHRPLLARAPWPAPGFGNSEPLLLEGEVVGAWLRTRLGSRPLAVHAAWRTDTKVAVAVTLRSLSRYRTPEPVRQARRLARAERT